MRMTHSTNDPTAFFDGDIPGGIRLQMPSGAIVEVLGDQAGIPLYDPLTGQEVFYPSWCEW